MEGLEEEEEEAAPPAVIPGSATGWVPQLPSLPGGPHLSASSPTSGQTAPASFPRRVSRALDGVFLDELGRRPRSPRPAIPLADWEAHKAGAPPDSMTRSSS